MGNHTALLEHGDGLGCCNHWHHYSYHHHHHHHHLLLLFFVLDHDHYLQSQVSKWLFCWVIWNKWIVIRVTTFITSKPLSLTLTRLSLAHSIPYLSIFLSLLSTYCHLTFRNTLVIVFRQKLYSDAVSVTISCVNLDKFINFFEPQFSHL